MGASNFQNVLHGESVPTSVGQLVVLGRGSLHALDTDSLPFPTTIVTGWQEISDLLVNAAGCVLVDFDLENMAEQLHSNVHGWNRLTVVACSKNDSVANIALAIRSGCFSFLAKTTSAEGLRNVVDQAIQADLAEVIDGDSAFQMRQKTSLLTAREREVLTLFLEGSNTKAIAHKLDVSYQTIDKHRNRGLRKLEATSLVSLARRFPLT